MSDVRAERVRTLAGEALHRADAARAGLEDLLGAVERLRSALSNGSVEAPPPPAPAITLDAARLVAIEMAVAGRSREEVERHLHVAYGAPGTDAVLADVFGEL